MKKIIIRWLIFSLFMIYNTVGYASDFTDRVSSLAKVESVRVYSNGDSKVRIVLDTSKEATYKTFVLSNPTRIAIDIKGAWISPLVPKDTPVKGGLVGKVRVSQFDADTVRVVVEANVSKERYKVFPLKADANANRKNRIVMDFGDLAQEYVAEKPVTEEALPQVTQSEFPTPKEIKFFDKPGLKNKIIAIDPGHGGSDPGSIGPTGAMEKDITLAICQELQKMLEESGAKVVMTRTKDVDVARPDATAKEELQARINVAEKAKADIFISVHMDAFVNREAKGTSTYIYPKTNGDERLGRFIKDGVVNQLATVDRNMRTCNFYVVKFSSMPATLLEVAFISNPEEEKLLKSASGVKKAARGIYQGVDRYFSYE